MKTKILIFLLFLLPCISFADRTEREKITVSNNFVVTGTSTLSSVMITDRSGETIPSWSEVLGIPQNSLDAFAASALGANIYVIGGDTGSSQTNVYSYNGTTWINVRGLPFARFRLSSVALNNKIYAIGGFDDAAKTNVLTYDGTNWVEVSGLPVSRYNHVTTILNNKIYVIGGSDSDGNIATNVYSFDTTNWTEVASLPMSFNGLSAATLNEKIYVFGGLDIYTVNRTNVYSYNETNWALAKELPIGKSYTSANTFNRNIYVVGGNSASGATTNVYLFNGTDWSEVASLPVTRNSLRSAILNNQFYVIGGKSDGGGLTNVYCSPLPPALQTYKDYNSNVVVAIYPTSNVFNQVTSISSLKLGGIIDANATVGASFVCTNSDTGAGAWVRPVAFMAYHGATNQNVETTASKITFTIEADDVGGCFDPANSRFTPGVLGRYVISAQLGYYMAEIGIGQRAVLIYRNGSLLKRQAVNVDPTEVSTVYPTITIIENVTNVTDYYEVYGTVPTDKTNQVIMTDSDGWFSATKVP